MSPRSKRVFKVCRPIKGQMVSVEADGRWERSYDIGRTTTPVEGSKLFAFATIEDAKSWKARLDVIFECKAKGTEKPNVDAIPLPDEKGKLLERFWDGKLRPDPEKDVRIAAGTVWCDELTPEKIIE